MKSNMVVKLGLVAAALAFAAPSSAVVAPITVTDSVAGSSGAWVHNFTVTNNLPNTNDIYFFGVSLGGNNIAGSPGVWDGTVTSSWSNDSYGGSALNYDNIWLNFNSTGLITPGSSLSGFKALDTGAVAATSVPWFAYAGHGYYYDVGCFHCGSNPGFEGVTTAGSGAVPEPASWALMVSGFGLMGAALRRRKTVVTA